MSEREKPDLVFGDDDCTIKIVPPKPKSHCPKCGATDADGTLTIEYKDMPEAGDYCLRCYARWLGANLPKMEPIEEGEA